MAVGSRFGDGLGADQGPGPRAVLGDHRLPEGVAHGFQTLRDDTEVMYTVSSPYTPSHYRGVRWNDPAFNILWPETQTRTMHSRDREYPDFTL